jgi:hypothetical protein
MTLVTSKESSQRRQGVGSDRWTGVSGATLSGVGWDFGPNRQFLGGNSRVANDSSGIA